MTDEQLAQHILNQKEKKPDLHYFTRDYKDAFAQACAFNRLIQACLRLKPAKGEEKVYQPAQGQLQLIQEGKR